MRGLGYAGWKKLQSGARKEGHSRGHNFSAVTCLWVIGTTTSLLLVSRKMYFFKPFMTLGTKEFAGRQGVMNKRFWIHHDCQHFPFKWSLSPELKKHTQKSLSSLTLTELKISPPLPCDSYKLFISSFPLLTRFTPYFHSLFHTQLPGLHLYTAQNHYNKSYQWPSMAISNTFIYSFSEISLCISSELGTVAGSRMWRCKAFLRDYVLVNSFWFFLSLCSICLCCLLEALSRFPWH